MTFTYTNHRAVLTLVITLYIIPLVLISLLTGILYLLNHLPPIPPPATISHLSNAADPSYPHSHFMAETLD